MTVTIIDQHGLLVSKLLKIINNNIIIGFDNIKFNGKRTRWVYSCDFNSSIIELKTWIASLESNLQIASVDAV